MPEPTQRTREGYEIPVPKRSEIDAALRKVAIPRPSPKRRKGRPKK